MKIAGLQKTTLIDYPGKVACTIFLKGCNFRCGFCYNPDLVVRDDIECFSEEEILEFLKKRQGKLDAVCITGGEPLMTLDFDFVRKIKAMGYLVKIDTNGSFPRRLKELIDGGLVDYIAMDIKAVGRDYSKVAAVNVDLSKIEESIKLIYGFGNYEFRTTVISRFHDVFSMRDLGRWITGLVGGKPKRFFLQGFRVNDEMIDSSFKDEKNVGEKYLSEIKDCISEYFGKVGIRV